MPCTNVCSFVGLTPVSDPNAAKKVKQYKVLASLLIGPRSKFECNICCRIFLDSDLAEANRHVNAEHELNILQYYKMASGKVSKGTLRKYFSSVTIDFTFTKSIILEFFQFVFSRTN